MKKYINWINPLLALSLTLILATGCKKDKDADLAGRIAGTYSGTATLLGISTVPCTTTINKSTENVVNLVITIETINIPFNGISVSSGGNNVYNLSYSDSSGTFEGQINGVTLTWTLTAGGITETFTGTKI